MDAKEVIENINTIYNRFKVPRDLQRHMKLVAAVTAQLCTQAQEDVDKDLLVACALLHDIGNIVKFSFDPRLNIKNVESEEELKQTQIEIKEKYGANDHEATMNMVKELSANKEIITILDEANWLEVPHLIEKSNLQPMILAYADYRVAPAGVVSVEDRIKDVQERYSLKLKDKFDVDLFTRSAQAYRLLEKKIFEKMSGSPQDITDESIQEFLILPMYEK